MKLRGKLIAVFLVVILIPIVSLGFLSFDKASRIIKDEMENVTSVLVDEIERSINNNFDVYSRSIGYLAKDHILGLYDFEDPGYETKVSEVLEDYINSYDGADYAYIGYENTEFVVYPFADVSFNPKERVWYKQAVEDNETIWTAPYTDDATKKTVITVASPVHGENDELVGVIGIDFNITDLRNDLLSIKVGETGSLILLDESNTIIVHENEELIGTELENTEILDIISDNSEDKFTYSEGENEKFAIYKTLDSLGWKVIVNMNMDEITSKANPISKIVTMVGLVAAVVALVISLAFSSQFINKIKILTGVIMTAKSGDLSKRFEYKGNDEINELGRDFNEMLEGISNLVKNTKEVTMKINSSSSELTSNSNNASQSSEEMSLSVDEIARGTVSQATDTERCMHIATNLENEISIIGKISENMISDSDKTTEINRNGLKMVEELKDKNDLNTTGINKINDAVIDLDANSRNIESILITIESISDQTSLLALNASIEAARAGEHGRGFGVVAEEIRKLAEESYKATQNIKGIVSGIKEKSENAINIMGEVNQRNDDQSKAVVDVMSIFDDIARSVEFINKQIGDMNSEVINIEKIKEDLIENVQNISAVSQQTSASVQQINASAEEQASIIEEVANAASELNVISKELEDEINKFRL